MNKRNTTLYVGMTSDVERRTHEHRTRKYKHSFSDKYNVHYLVYYEYFGNLTEALYREKQLKNWHRDWKWNLIKSVNPELKDLSKEETFPLGTSGVYSDPI